MTAYGIPPESSDAALSSDVVACQSSYVMINLDICAVLGKLIVMLPFISSEYAAHLLSTIHNWAIYSTPRSSALGCSW
jgi:hypothetical protein